MADIVSIGEAMVEFHQAADGNYRQGFGGDTSNCLIAAASHGGDCAYVTMIGEDHFGDLLLALWQKHGIDTSCVLRHADASTGIYFINDDKSRHRFSYYRKGSAANYLRPQDLSASLLAGCKVLHLSAISQSIGKQAREACAAAVSLARGGGALISYDTNLRLNLWSVEEARSVILPMIKECDILMPSLEDSQILTGLRDTQAILDFYVAESAAIILLTMGEAGAWVVHGKERRHIASPSVDCVDTTGAGDVFDGVFLTRYLQSGDIFQAAEEALQVAALSTTFHGAMV